MCQMLNMFVPAPRVPGAAVPGLTFGAVGELQKDFVRRYKHLGGTFLVGEGGSSCLCGFQDWAALYTVSRTIMSSTSTDWIALVHFWSGDRYELMEREADPEDPQQCTPLETGELVVLRSVPAERRRHRLVVRALQESVGRRVTLEFKNRRAVSGVLADFDAESGVGRLDELVFVAGQVWAVQAGTA